ncbi:MAG: hypothetical protein IPL26_23165 [Leptospiraceae bacterium]|nr:hypothetical protein [Leptospiraceae bacterium]
MVYNWILLVFLLMALNCKEPSSKECLRDRCYVKVDQEFSKKYNLIPTNASLMRVFSRETLYSAGPLDLLKSDFNLLKKEDTIFMIDDCAMSEMFLVTEKSHFKLKEEGYYSKLDILILSETHKDIVGKIHKIWLVRDKHHFMIEVTKDRLELTDPCFASCYPTFE